MVKTIDARGLQCPLPVIETKKALESMDKGIIEVLTDNFVAVQNLLKMVKQKGLEASFEKQDDDNYRVSIAVGESAPVVQKSADMNEAGREHEKQAPKQTRCSFGDYVAVFSSERMGQGDDELGRILMKGFLYALTELEELPSKILLYNSGARLSVEGSDSLEDLRLLESQGVEILTCGTCLNYYGLADRLAVGSATNMYVIAETMAGAGKILSP